MNTHLPSQSSSLSLMISEAAFRVVNGVDRLGRFVWHKLR